MRIKMVCNTGKMICNTPTVTRFLEGKTDFVTLVTPVTVISYRKFFKGLESLTFQIIEMLISPLLQVLQPVDKYLKLLEINNLNGNSRVLQR